MENSTDFGAQAYDDDIDLRELFSVLWAGKKEIIGGILLSTLIAVSLALYLPNKYTSEALLAPRNDGGGGGPTPPGECPLGDPQLCEIICGIQPDLPFCQ